MERNSKTSTPRQSPLSLSTLDEAVAWLSDVTGDRWTWSHLFDQVLHYGLTLRAAPSLDAIACVMSMSPDCSRLVKRYELGWAMAVLHPFNIAQVWQTGATRAAHSVAPPVLAEGEWALFDPPVSVDGEMVRVPRDSLQQLLVLRERSAALRGSTSISTALGQVSVPTQAPLKAADNWSKGLKRIAWDCASAILSAGGELDGSALLAAMEKSGYIEDAQNGAIRCKQQDGNCGRGEAVVQKATVKKDWPKALKKLKSNARAG